jgi:hypothetical protein
MSMSQESLVAEAQALTREIDGELLAFASPDARAEWEAVRASFTSPAAEASNFEPQLPITLAKARRFKAILWQARERSTVASEL